MMKDEMVGWHHRLDGHEFEQSPEFVTYREAWHAGIQFSSVASDSLQPHGLQHTRLPCPSPTPRVAQTHVLQVGTAIQPSHPLSSTSPAFNLQSSGSFPMSQLFTSGGQSIGVSASTSVLPMNIQD